MNQLLHFLAVFLLIIALLALVLVVIAIRTRRQRKTSNVRSPRDKEAVRGDVHDARAEDEESASSYLPAIVNQLESIERTNKRQLYELTAVMVDSKNWRALGDQFDNLSDKRLAHLRALTKRSHSALPAQKALGHTVEAYRLSRLMLDLYEKFVVQSEVVTSVMDEWFRARQNMSMAEFISKIHLDCVRILLLNLDYAQPSRKTALEQLGMAEACCHIAGPQGEEGGSTVQALLAEIALRKERLLK